MIIKRKTPAALAAAISIVAMAAPFASAEGYVVDDYVCSMGSDIHQKLCRDVFTTADELTTAISVDEIECNSPVSQVLDACQVLVRYLSALEPLDRTNIEADGSVTRIVGGDRMISLHDFTADGMAITTLGSFDPVTNTFTAIGPTNTVIEATDGMAEELNDQAGDTECRYDEGDYESQVAYYYPTAEGRDANETYITEGSAGRVEFYMSYVAKSGPLRNASTNYTILHCINGGAIPSPSTVWTSYRLRNVETSLQYFGPAGDSGGRSDYVRKNLPRYIVQNDPGYATTSRGFEASAQADGSGGSFGGGFQVSSTPLTARWNGGYARRDRFKPYTYMHDHRDNGANFVYAHWYDYSDWNGSCEGVQDEDRRIDLMQEYTFQPWSGGRHENEFWYSDWSAEARFSVYRFGYC